MKISPLSLESPRLLIRTYAAGDADALHGMVTAEKETLKDYFPLTVESNTTAAASRSFIKTRLAEMKDGKSAFLGIFEKQTNRLIGQIAIKDVNWRVPKCELGYFIISTERGKGLAPEAVNAVAEFCFTKANMAKLLLRIEDINNSSRKVAEKCGFSHSGTLRNDFRSADGRLMDCEVWEKIK